jgi:choline dehydrogenase-like flavoprotein
MDGPFGRNIFDPWLQARTGESDMNDVDVIIAGGGIGGLANALALALARQRVRVLERSSEFTEVGAGLQMAPNATRILRQWGLLDQVTEAGVSPRRLVFRDAVDGSVLTSAPLGADFTARYQAPYVVIHRNDLLTIRGRGIHRARSAPSAVPAAPRGGLQHGGRVRLAGVSPRRDGVGRARGAG